jgi:hypothetical protein
MAPVEVCQSIRKSLTDLNGDVTILWICPMAGTTPGAVGVKRKNATKESEDKIKKAKFVVVKDTHQPMTLLEILEQVRKSHCIGKPYKIWDTGAITDAEGEPSRGPVFNEGLVRMPMVSRGFLDCELNFRRSWAATASRRCPLSTRRSRAR